MKLPPPGPRNCPPLWSHSHCWASVSQSDGWPWGHVLVVVCDPGCRAAWSEPWTGDLPRAWGVPEGHGSSAGALASICWSDTWGPLHSSCCLWLGRQVCAWQRHCLTVSYKMSVVARETGTGSVSAGWKLCDGADDGSSRGGFWCSSWCSAAWTAGLSELHYSGLLPSHLLVFVLTLGWK